MEARNKIYRFVEFLFESASSLNEGGKVFDGTSRIDKDQVNSTVDDVRNVLFKKLGIEGILMGSAGHTKTSGDIDFGIETEDLESVYDAVRKEFPELETNFIKGLEVVSVGWPIKGTSETVQVDMIPVYDKDWSSFVYRFPTGSKYKSAHRNWLMMAILSSIREDVKKDEDGNTISYDGHMMNLNKGLFDIKKSYVGKTKLLKHGKIVEEKPRTTDPKEAVRFIFGDGFTPKEVETFEDCVNIMKNANFRWKDRMEDIKRNLRKFLERVELEVPKELDTL